MKSLEELWTDPALRPALDRADCPPRGLLTDLANGDLPRGERERLVDHLVDCPDCAADLRALQALGSWARAAEDQLEGAPLSAQARSRTSWRWVAAAALVVGVGIGWQVGRNGPPASASGSGGFIPSPAIIDLLPEGALRSAMPQGRRRVELPSRGGAPTVLVLHIDRPEATGRYAVEIVRGASTTARIEDLAPGPFGTVSIAVTGEGIAPGDCDLVLRSATTGDSEVAARYLLHFANAE